ncbi:MAG: succinate dehydrogenase cytochrome b subunit [Firmicutes bacterium]|nr:succinate dehydrogenase cytochrome b subunit [Bacillota bacterium]
MATRHWSSTVGKKLIMGLTGLLLIGYLIIHLTANLLVFAGDGGRLLNLYAHTLHQTGPLLVVARILLAALFLFHIVSGIRVTLQNRRGRTRGYAQYASKGGPSKMTPASRWMIVTGLILMVFVPLHVNMFSLGPHYETVIDGQPMRDLYRLVVERFKEPQVAFSYAAVMLFLCLHLSHGFWSALQSLGAMNRRWTPFAYTFGVVLSILLAGGFFILPLYTYFFIPLP